VLAFPTAELAFAMQHGCHGGTISALLYAVAGVAMLVFHA
jgi:acyl-coenzyme A thioesterase PaaI-like protein